MLTTTASEFQRRSGEYQDAALREPVMITKSGRERTVLLSAQEYHRLKRRDRIAMSVFDLDEETIQLIANSEPPEYAKQFDHEL